jgi:hypothetical protein
VSLPPLTTQPHLHASQIPHLTPVGIGEAPKGERPKPLDLTYDKTMVAAKPPSVLARARFIDDLARVLYPEGFSSPKVELNINAKDGKFR